jgi:hypothetical protein
VRRPVDVAVLQHQQPRGRDRLAYICIQWALVEGARVFVVYRKAEKFCCSACQGLMVAGAAGIKVDQW